MVAQGKAIAGGVVMMTAGAVVLSATLLAMNGKIHRADKVRREILADMSVKKKKKPPVKKKIQRRKPPPKRSRPSRAPRPTIASDLGGLGGGVPMFSANVSNLSDELGIGKSFTQAKVMTADAVDRLPELRPGNPQPKYPSRARAKGVEGSVLLRFVVAADGSVRSVNIIESDPEGVFDEAVLDVAREWTFELALYKGQPVQMTFEMPLAFRLN